MTQHPQAELLRAIADGETLEWFEPVQSVWAPVDPSEVLGFLGSGASLRVVPRSININGYEVPEPMRVAPPTGTQYFTPGIYLAGGTCLSYQWVGNRRDLALLDAGVCHITAAAAGLHTEALLSFTKL